MPTDMTSPRVALFVFAHQDDEYGVFQALVDELHAGSTVYCAYLSDGSYGGCSPLQRNQESLKVLTDIGVAPVNIVFAGHEQGIADGALPEHVHTCAHWLRSWFAGFAGISAIYVPAWEGGHHDHDALHAAVVSVAESLGLMQYVWQFPLYNSMNCRGPLFRVFNPLADNGAVILREITLRNRVRFLRYCLSYPSQRRTWLGLFPFVLFHYLHSGTQQLQRASTLRLAARPHAGALYYEKRAFFSWSRMQTCIAALQGTSRSQVSHEAE